MRYFLVTLLLAQALSSSGQRAWQRVISTDKDAYLSALDVGPKGTIFTAGHSNGLNTNGDYDMLVYAYDSTGFPLWKKSISSNEDDISNGLHACVDGGVIVAGFTGVHEAWPASSKPVVYKLDGSGELEWQWVHKSATNGRYSRVIEDGSGGYWAIGRRSIRTDKRFEGFITHLNKNGKHLGSYYLGRSKATAVLDIEPLGNGKLLIAGSVTGFIHGNFAADVFMALLDTARGIRWAKAHGIVAADVANRIFRQSDNKFITMMSYNDKDAGLAKIGFMSVDTAGNVDAVHQISGISSNLIARGSYQTQTGEIAFTGMHRKNGATNRPDLVLGSIDTSFNLIGAQLFRTTEIDSTSRIINSNLAELNGYPLLAGFSNGFSQNQEFDQWLIRSSYNTATGTSVKDCNDTAITLQIKAWKPSWKDVRDLNFGREQKNELDSMTFTVSTVNVKDTLICGEIRVAAQDVPRVGVEEIVPYPNPASASSGIIFPNNSGQPVSIRVFSLNGQLLYSNLGIVGDLALRADELKPGMLIYEVRSESTELLGRGKLLLNP